MNVFWRLFCRLCHNGSKSQRVSSGDRSGDTIQGTCAPLAMSKRPIKVSKETYSSIWAPLAMCAEAYGCGWQGASG